MLTISQLEKDLAQEKERNHKLVRLIRKLQLALQASVLSRGSGDHIAADQASSNSNDNGRRSNNWRSLVFPQQRHNHAVKSFSPRSAPSTRRVSSLTRTLRNFVHSPRQPFPTSASFHGSGPPLSPTASMHSGGHHARRLHREKGPHKQPNVRNVALAIATDRKRQDAGRAAVAEIWQNPPSDDKEDTGATIDSDNIEERIATLRNLLCQTSL